ncbi:MAG TPA: methionyl-tRNA formyltransferase [Casimicrobiaceae bacterium]|nr:methionyl-tRNA formyltransferase [Casimicrobiaceae bacterium]
MPDALRVGFAGTPPFAATALAAIVDAGHEVALVFTQPDRPQGRGLRVASSPVKALAVERGLPLLQPPTLKGAPLPTGARVDVLVVAAYGLILPPAMLDWPRHGAINIHASLLPRWRGAAPIQRALLAGDKETGVSIMQMDAGLDTGPVISRTVVAIAPRDTAGTLTERLAAAGAGAIVRTLVALAKDGALASQPQDASAATYAGKIERAEASIRWSDDAVAIDRVVRAFNPAPGAFATLHGETIKIWVAEPTSGSFGPAGGIVSADGNGLLVACGRGALLVRELQRAGGRRLPAASFLAGHPVAAGASFDAESD